MPFIPSAAQLQFGSGQEIGYDQITAANVNVVSTTEATGTTIIACNPHTFDGNPVMAEFFCPLNVLGSDADAATVVSLFEGATQIGELCWARSPSTGTTKYSVLNGLLRFTPTAGAHTYTVTAFCNGTNGTPRLSSGAGGTGALVPSFIRFTKV